MSRKAKVTFYYKAVQDDEIDLEVGSVITNIINKDTGWCEGEVNGKRGMFPNNFVEFIPNGVEKASVQPEAHPAVAGKKGKVTFRYEKENDDELTLEVDDIVDILGEDEEGWWKGRLWNRIGVFPCNFVEIIEDTAHLEPMLEEKPGAPQTSKREPTVSYEEAQTADVEEKRNSAMLQSKKLPGGGVGFGNLVNKDMLAKKLKKVHLDDKKEERNESTVTEAEKVTPNKGPKSAKTRPAPPVPAAPQSKKLSELAIVICDYDPHDQDELMIRVGNIITIINKDVADNEGWWEGELNGKVGMFPNNFVELLPSDDAVAPTKDKESKDDSKMANKKKEAPNFVLERKSAVDKVKPSPQSKKRAIYIVLHVSSVSIGELVGKATAPVKIYGEKILVEMETADDPAGSQTLTFRIPCKDLVECKANFTGPPFLIFAKLTLSGATAIQEKIKGKGKAQLLDPENKDLHKSHVVLLLNYKVIPRDAKTDLIELFQNRLSEQLTWSELSPDEAQQIHEGKRKAPLPNEETNTGSPILNNPVTSKQRRILTPKVAGKKGKVTFRYVKENDDELTLEVDDIVDILGEEEEGWWKGRLWNRIGVFPSNFVEIIEDTAHLEPMLEKKPGKKFSELAIVICDYDPQDQDELMIRVGNIITVINKDVADNEGWWEGELNGKVGMFPNNFVELLPSDDAVAPTKDKESKDDSKMANKKKEAPNFVLERKSAVDKVKPSPQSKKRAIYIVLHVSSVSIGELVGKATAPVKIYGEKILVEMETADDPAGSQTLTFRIPCKDLVECKANFTGPPFLIFAKLTLSGATAIQEKIKGKGKAQLLDPENKDLHKSHVVLLLNYKVIPRDAKTDLIELFQNRLSEQLTWSELSPDEAQQIHEGIFLDREREARARENRDHVAVAQDAVADYHRLEPRDWIIRRDEVQLNEKRLGVGAWGTVWEGSFRGCQVAVKQIHQLILSPHNRRLFEREMSIASRCRHPNLLQFIGATNDDGSPLFITELLDSDLRRILAQRALHHEEIVCIALDIARGLNYLHLNKPFPILHRDISSSNVLLWRREDTWRAKLSDYGAANFLGQCMTANPGALIYAAPESRTSQQSPKTDVYSFGLLLCEMCVRELPVPEQIQEQINLVSSGVLRELIMRCVERNPEARPSMGDVITVLVQLTESLRAQGLVSINGRSATL